MPPVSDKAAVEAQIRRSPALYAKFVNTLNVTMVNSGIKVNVIPAKSEAFCDCRLLPGQDREEWRSRSRPDRRPRIEVELASGTPGDAPGRPTGTPSCSGPSTLSSKSRWRTRSWSPR